MPRAPAMRPRLIACCWLLLDALLAGFGCALRIVGEVAGAATLVVGHETSPFIICRVVRRRCAYLATSQRQQAPQRSVRGNSKFNEGGRACRPRASRHAAAPPCHSGYRTLIHGRGWPAAPP